MHKVFKRSVNLANGLVNVTEIKNKLFKMSREKCAENAPEGTFDALLASYENMTTCMISVKNTTPLFVASANGVKLAIEKCVDALVEGAATCLPDEEKYFPEFSMTVFYNIIDFLYEKKDQLASLRGELASCSRNLQNENEENYSASSCSKSRSHKEKDLSKKSVCRNFQDEKDCVSKKFNQLCKQQMELNNMVEEFLETILKPCK